MRACMAQALIDMGKENNLSDIVKLIISGDMAKNVAKACRVVIPIKRVDIRKSEVLAAGEGEPESIMAAFEQPKEEDQGRGQDHGHRQSEGGVRFGRRLRISASG